jgi:K+-sensing histidine kinase KdpD
VIQLSEKNLASIISEMTRLTELVNQIMEYEKFENSQIELKKEAYNPYELISAVSETQKIALEETKQSIIIS